MYCNFVLQPFIAAWDYNLWFVINLTGTKVLDYLKTRLFSAYVVLRLA